MSFNTRRVEHLSPLTKMTVFEIFNHIEGLSVSSLKDLVNTMSECTTTNCCWIEYRISIMFFNHAEKVLRKKDR